MQNEIISFNVKTITAVHQIPDVDGQGSYEVQVYAPPFVYTFKTFTNFYAEFEDEIIKLREYGNNGDRTVSVQCFNKTARSI